MPEENTAPYAYPPDLARFVQFDKGDESVVVGVDGALYIDDLDTSIRAAADDVGLAFSFVEQ